jgi:ribonuclease G
MKLPDNMRKVKEAMENYMKTDRAKHSVLPISKFGLCQITRQRMRPEVNINTSENCPVCSGTGKIMSTLLLEDEIEKKIAYLSTHSHKKLILSVNPIVHSYLTKGFFTSIIKRWKRKYGISLKAKANTNNHLVEYRFFNEQDEEVKL